MRSLTHARTGSAHLWRTAKYSLLATLLLLFGFASASGAQTAGAQTEDQKLEGASDDDFDVFAHATAISGDIMVIGDPADDETGAAYVYERTDDGWVESQKLTGNADYSEFGHAVAIDDDRIVVTAPSEYPDYEIEADFNVTLLGEPISEFTGFGAVYVFTYDGDEWVQEQRLSQDDFGSVLGEGLDFDPGNLRFGTSVAIDGERLVIGAPDQGRFPLLATAEVSPLQFSAGSGIGGSVFAYEFDEGSWIGEEELSIEPTNFEAEFALFNYGNMFGYSVALDGDTLAVGAPADRVLPEFDFLIELGLPDQGPSIGNGAAYIYEYDNGGWEQQARLAGDENDQVVERLEIEEFDFRQNGIIGGDFVEGDQFGYSVAIDDGTVVVGALLEDGETYDEGAAYLFTEQEGSWTQEQTLTSPDPQTGARFGRSISIDGDRILAGAPFQNNFTGAAFTFVNDGTAWIADIELVGSDIEETDGFGFATALDGETAVVGAPLNQFFPGFFGFGVPGDLEIIDEDAFPIVSGSAYLFELAPEEVTAVLCNGEEVTVNLALGETPTNGDDVILGTDDADVINGGAGNDIICGGDGADTINGGAGNDTIDGGQGRDVLRGGVGDDTLRGQRGKDTLNGDKGTDTLNGGKGDDNIRGGKGRDTLSGDGGADTLNGNVGTDSYDGGVGNDTCALDPNGITETAISCKP